MASQSSNGCVGYQNHLGCFCDCSKNKKLNYKQQVVVLEQSCTFFYDLLLKYTHDLPYFFNIRISTISTYNLYNLEWTQANPLPRHQIRIQINAKSNYVLQTQFQIFFNSLHIGVKCQKTKLNKMKNNDLKNKKPKTRKWVNLIPQQNLNPN